MQEFKTTTREAKCCKCNVITSCLFFKHSIYVCGNCKSYVKGAPSIVPCTLCIEPNIYWFIQDDYDDSNNHTNCNRH